ncbi:hypothetical protein NPIL_391811 [Nephila pilipes]|uniref:Uncharacterized protein n=1 Tax=Nephila pilipes TaxID=299642 RepID=A0A8X6UIS7_NEPPI|nr:hypothetical protein NPIL_391811 [Nephila pilipes]
MIKPSLIPGNDVINEMLAVRMVTLKKHVTTHHSCDFLLLGYFALHQKQYDAYYHNSVSTLGATILKVTYKSFRIISSINTAEKIIQVIIEEHQSNTEEVG